MKKMKQMALNKTVVRHEKVDGGVFHHTFLDLGVDDRQITTVLDRPPKDVFVF